MFESIVSADLTQIYVCPYKPPPDYAFCVGSFTIGPLDAQHVAYRSEKAGSDYWLRYKTQIDGCLAVERNVIRAKAVNWSRMQQQTGSLQIHYDQPNAVQHGEAITLYFENLSQAYFTDFWNTFDEEQDLQLAVGGGYSVTTSDGLEGRAGSGPGRASSRRTQPPPW